MIGTIAKTELLDLVRGARSRALLVGVALLLLISGWSAAGFDSRQREAHETANELAREQWLGQGAGSAHGMAHFGDYAFRPSGPLARLDSGVQAHLGRVLRLEGHVRGTAVHSAAGVAGPLVRFGRLEPAFVLQVLLPLLLIFLGSGIVASERESGRLKLALVQGATPKRLLLGKALALWLIGAAGLVLVVGAELVRDLGGTLEASGNRLAALAGVHLAFLAVIACVTAAFSALSRRAAGALSVLLILWTLGSVVAPRVTARLASDFSPLPTRDTFEKEMQADREQGLDGHNPQDQRLLELQQKVLKEYNVRTVQELPFNFGGMAMQADEEYGNEVWDEHFGRLTDIFESQTGTSRVASFFNPFQAIDAVSMALAGTDLFHDLDFQNQAEHHRRELVKALNHEQTFGEARTGGGHGESSAEFFAGIDSFHYEPPALDFVFSTRGAELVALLLWAAGGVGVLLFAGSGLRTRSVT